MRTAVVKAIYNHALVNPKIIFMTADQSHAHLDDFKKNIPNQYINVGIAEQNMVGIAAGLALSGNKVFIFAITPFAVLRCLEQIKVDICYQNVDVTVIGIGAGFVYGTSGCTHHAIEDIAMMRALPNMHLYSPSNPHEARLITEYLFSQSHPAYLRIAKEGEPMPEKDYALVMNAGLVMRPGNDITIFSTGTIVSEALKAAEILENTGISAEVINIHTIKPLDESLVRSRIPSRNALYVLEEHNIMGGLGEAIARVVVEADFDLKPPFRCFGVPDVYGHRVGSQKYMRESYGLNSENIARKIIQLYLKAS